MMPSATLSLHPEEPMLSTQTSGRAAGTGLLRRVGLVRTVSHSLITHREPGRVPTLRPSSGSPSRNRSFRQSQD